jgi:beta-glucosidase
VPTDVEILVAQLTLDEKAALTAGADFWTLVSIDRAGVRIPPIRVTDGPNGARGSALFGLGTETAVCVPCGSALGATWDPELVERVGVMLGEETLTKACRVLLAPTVNLHRSPIAGRNFECYSEDPLLSGTTAAAFVRGVQSQGVVTTVKHFAGNDAEFERQTINSVIDERALRELYLVPFELAVREGGTLGVMTAYNRLNGPHCSEHHELITSILREEWGFEGFVLTDWLSAGSTLGSSAAGLDLEMPGPARFYGEVLAEAVRNGEVEEAAVDAHVTHLLDVFRRVGALDDPSDWESTSIDRPEHRDLAREAATSAMVLLKNDGVLPFDTSSLRTLAVLGPNAERPQMMGGGSANLAPHYRISPLDALRARLGHAVAVRYERAVDIDRTAAPMATEFTVDWFAGRDHGGEAVASRTYRDGRLLLVDTPPAGIDIGDFSYRATGRYTPDESGPHTLSLVQIGGRARVLVDGTMVLDGVTDPPGPGTEFFGMASAELEATVELYAGAAVEVVVEFAEQNGFFMRGVKLGLRRPSPPDLLDRAIAAARDVDAVVVVVGTNDDWESEGHDRDTMDLPGRQDELVARAIAANPNTAVVVNTGAPVTMPWADDARAVLQAWFGGQEMANALAEVLTGDAEPAGRLPTSFPVRLEHNPSFGNFPGECGEVRYGEGVLIGYRWYDTRHLPTRFPFGHGLSYTTFELGAPDVAQHADSVVVSVPVTNTGTRRGAEVVQCYVAPPQPSRLVRPVRELKAFAKVWLDPGEQTTVALELDERAFQCWEPAERRGWWTDPGTYDLHVGRSSGDLPFVVSVER